MATPLIRGLQRYNEQNGNLWIIPRKGTPQNDRLLNLMGSTEKANKQATARYETMIAEEAKNQQAIRELNELMDGFERARKLKSLEKTLDFAVKAKRVHKFIQKIQERVRAND